MRPYSIVQTGAAHSESKPGLIFVIIAIHRHPIVISLDGYYSKGYDIRLLDPIPPKGIHDLASLRCHISAFSSFTPRGSAALLAPD